MTLTSSPLRAHRPAAPTATWATVLSTALTALLMTGTAHASTPEEVARASGCLSCHSPQEKIVGPAFKSIAEKYRGQPDMVNTLAQVVRNGSRGTWGRIPMPPHPSLEEKDIKQIVTWILTH
jgi:cytochrome c